ncbi:hypothetical protein GJ496_006644, partial [Pomphorhynchus laevis]
RASRLARTLGIPRVYIAANSGARIGVSEKIKDRFKISWVDQENPSKGIDYLYLLNEDLNLVGKDTVELEEIEKDGETRYKICSILGGDEDIGVENLKGSALIAGETSRAYDEIPTYSMITCRSVGIGAYLVRLGHRTVQVKNSHIILTGFNALNKVLGREVYTSNNQLGGINIMYNNGVSHFVAKDDFDGIRTLVRWISYTPYVKNAIPCMMVGSDSIERPVDFYPAEAVYNPRDMIAGCSKDGTWYSGLFDKNSFDEVMGGWAKTVICGRARLGGIAVGVIATETRGVELEHPADPADLESNARTIQQAGQVWFPDSSYKTAQAIKDFNREELPLFILANWRGFSGGMKDMYEQILKFGAMIVDSLRTYRQSVFVYLPPKSELRGGAWAVIDPSINPDFMEILADENSRGGVLEPEGTIQIRYRTHDLYRTMNRLDTLCDKLCQDPDKSDQLLARQRHLESFYIPATIMFADLHDRPNRMLKQNAIKCIVPFVKSRVFFYWRLKRRIYQDDLLRRLETYMNRSELLEIVITWFEEIIDDELNQSKLEEQNKCYLHDLLESKHFDDQSRADQLICNLFSHQKSKDEIEKRFDSLVNQCLLNKIKCLFSMNPQCIDDVRSFLSHNDAHDQ